MHPSFPTQSSSRVLNEVAPFPVLLAPMVGLTHLVVRKALQEYLPSGSRTLWPTEMLSSRRLPYQRSGQQIETRFDDHALGLCPQLLGNEEHHIRDSIQKLKDWGARAIDINMGCPVKRALKHNYGVALMGDPDYAAEVTSWAVKYAEGLPVSVKLRAAPPPDEFERRGHPSESGNSDPEFLKVFCLKLQEAGASWITLHPRTATQYRKGSANWSQIASLKKWLKIPVIGNGDIQTLEDIQQMFSETGCDRVMIGRALMSKPWLLRAAWNPKHDIVDAVEAGREYGRFLARVLELMREEYVEESLATRKFKFLVSHGATYLQYGHTFYTSLRSAENYAQLGQRISEFFGPDFNRPQPMSKFTSIRK